MHTRCVTFGHSAAVVYARSLPMVAMCAPSTSGRLASIPARGRSRHEAQVHLARRAIYAVGEQAATTGIELPVAPELAPWGYAERRLAFARPDLGHRRFHVVARHLQQARQFAFPLA